MPTKNKQSNSKEIVSAIKNEAEIKAAHNKAKTDDMFKKTC